MAGSTDSTARTTDVLHLGDVRIQRIREGQGRPIVLLPSLGRGQRDFDPIAPLFAAAGYRVLRPEPRGIGQSRGPAAGVTLQALAGDIAAVIRAEEAGPAIVLGHAFGNWVARNVAVFHPELVRGVVLAAAAARVQSPEVRAALDVCKDATRESEDRLAALQFAFFAPGHDPSGWLEGWSAEATQVQRTATAASPREAWWHAGRAPILDLIAAHDPFRPPATRRENADEFGDRVTIHIIDGASHALIPEQPAAVVAAIDAWSRSLAT